MAEKIAPDAIKAEFTPDLFGLRLTGLVMRRSGEEVDLLRHAMAKQPGLWSTWHFLRKCFP